MHNSITFKEYIERIQIKDHSVITIGNFDGLHRGHMELIDRTVEIAKREDLISIVFSYEVHPQNVLYKKLVYLIMPPEEKERILFEKGIYTVLQVPFDEGLQTQTALRFCDEVLIKKLKAKYLVMGEDARFGCEMLDALSIKRYLETKGVKVELIPLKKIDGERISSSKIRRSIEEGDIRKAEEYLGRPFEIIGKVVHGKKRGKITLGYPTANLGLIPDQAVPAKGVYQTIVEYDGVRYDGATSVGNNPTFGENPLTVETFILDFDKIIYGKTIKLKFVRKLREELVFSSLDGLIAQMDEDVRQIRENSML
ncbi:MAG: riboflavin biosynthesis protein RibF [Peptostreptococcaceae bacterium]|nr:riboflavin biosynthesis protein RibF [Peptostreptococcaceae bacterium]